MNHVANDPSAVWHTQVNASLPRLNEQIHRFDYFSLMRQLESMHLAEHGAFGKSSSPKQEKIRIVQEPLLIFQSRQIQSVQVYPHHIEIALNGFGLFGTNAPLPLHLTEYAYERKHQHGDSTWVGFANIFQNRLAILFYRAWANAQSIIALDKNAHDGFGGFVASLNGVDFDETCRLPEKIHPYALRYFSGILMPQSRSAQNLQDLLHRYFGISVSIESNIGHWLDMPQTEQTAIGQCGVSLGEGVLLGSKLYDVASRFRIVLGPLDLSGYRSFFKKENNVNRLAQWVRIFVGDEYEWEIQPILAQDAVPAFQLGGQNQLGLTTWLGQVKHDADDLIIIQNH